MRDTDPASESEVDEGKSRPTLLALAMREIWEGQDQAKEAELFVLASDAFDGRARQYLAREYGLNLDQVDDCVGEALEILLKKWKGSATDVDEPYAYLWGTAKRRALVMQRLAIADPVALIEQDDEGLSSDRAEPVEIEAEIAAIWFEELTEHDTLPEDRAWVVEVIVMAVARLPTALRRVAEFMLRPEFDHRETTAQEACAALGMSSAAYRQNKHRVLERLRKAIPEIVEELGIELTPREAESVFVDRPRVGQGD